MSIKEFVRELNGNRVEGELIKTVFYSLITAVITLGALYYLRLKYVVDFMPKYSTSLFFATNGMFIGGFFGVVLGIGMGIYMGRCCGVMGVMEGMMAGFMGGLMGAMTAFMLINDHLWVTAVLVFVINAIILTSLNYMVYIETKTAERHHKEDYFGIVFLTLILIAVTTWLIVFGPRGGAFA